MKFFAALVAAALLVLHPIAVKAAPDNVVAAQSVAPLAPGVTLTSFERLYQFGWVKGHLLEADLSRDGVSADLIAAPTVTAAERMTVMADRTGALAAVNGDFFDINNTKAPLGPAVRGGEMLKSAPEGFNAAGVGADRIGRLTGILLEGKVTTPSGTYKLASLNQYTVPGGGIGLYTPQWSVPRKGAAYGAARVCEVVVRDGKVVSVAPSVNPAPAAAGTMVLVGREEGAAVLSQLKVGDPVSITYGPAPNLKFAVGGGDVLLRGGQVQKVDDRGYKPRSAIGFSADGKRMFLLTVDGRSEESGGLTLLQLARLMLELGANDALELDGGGSAQMVARQPGASGAEVVNQPSDGAERPVPNGVGIFVPKGSGMAVGVAIRPVGGSDRVFPGLTRRLTAAGYDEQFGPALTAPPVWSGAVAGVARGTAPGRQTVQVRSGTLSGALELTVLGPLERIEFDTAALRLAPGEVESFRLVGYDAEGYSAPIEPDDVSLAFAAPDLRVEPAGDGSFRAQMNRAGQAVVVAQVQGKTASLPVAAGARAAAVSGFELPGAWGFDRYPATAVSGSIATVPGRTRSGLKLTYQFGAGATRAAYATGGLALPGKPSALGLWVYGDGQGAWLRAEITDKTGARRLLDLALKIDWTGWRYVEAAIPSGLVAPIRLERIYPVETNRDRQYGGSLIFDDLLVKLPVALPEVPAAPAAAPDPMLISSPAGGRPFALGLTASATKDQIKQAVAAGAELVVLAGGAVGAPGLAGLSREVTVPIYGLTAGTWFDWNGTRFIGLDTATGSLRTSNFSQLPDLQKRLSEAAADPTVRALVLVTATPPSRYSDWREASLMSRWLTEFRTRSGGKPVAYLASAGTTAVRRHEGVAYVEIAGGGAVAKVAQVSDPGTAAAPVWLSVASWR